MKKIILFLILSAVTTLSFGQKKQNYKDLLEILEGKIDVVYDSMKYYQKMDSIYPTLRSGDTVYISSFLMRKLDLEWRKDTLVEIYTRFLDRRQQELKDSIFVKNLRDKFWDDYIPVYYNKKSVYK